MGKASDSMIKGMAVAQKSFLAFGHRQRVKRVAGATQSPYPPALTGDTSEIEAQIDLVTQA